MSSPEVARLDRRVNAQDESLRAVADTVIEIKDVVDSHTTTLAEIKDVVNSHTTTLAEHGRQLTEHGRQLTEHGRQLTEHGRQLTEHGRQLTEHGRQLGEIRREQKRQATELTDIRTSVAEILRLLNAH